MPWPPTLTIVTVHGKIVQSNVNQTPATGWVYFTIPFPLRDSADNVVLAPTTFTATLDLNGEFTIDLPATDDADISPLGWTYRCKVATNVWREVFPIAIPAASPSPLEFADIPRAENVPPVQVYALIGHTHAGGGGGAVTSVFGRTGAVIAQGGDYTKAQVGLGNVDNTSDASKPISTATQSALDGKSALGHTHATTDLVSGTLGVVRGGTGLATVAIDSYLKGNGTNALVPRTPAQVLSDIGASAAVHTHAIGDVTGLQAALDSKEAVVAAGTTSQYWRGDKSWQTLDKAAVGLANVDNTSDANKPISTATQTALDGKQPLDSDLTTIAGLTATTNNFIVSVASAWASRTPAQVKTTLALDNVDNTSDANKPISTATQTALDGKQPLDSDLTTIAGLTATTDNVIQSVGSAWASRTPAQLKSTLALTKSDVGLANVDNTSDATKFANTALTGTTTAVNLTQTGRYLNTPDTLTDAATIAVDASLGNDFKVTLGGNRTLGNPTNSVDGQKILFAIRQDGTGSRTLTLDTNYRLGADISAVTLSTGANKTDYLGVRYNAADTKWDVIAFVKGY